MEPLVTCDDGLVVHGVIQDIDTTGREVQILAPGGRMDFDVPVSCAIFVNDERVKLRLLQVGDVVQIRYTMTGDTATASSIRASGIKSFFAQATSRAGISRQAQ